MDCAPKKSRLLKSALPNCWAPRAGCVGDAGEQSGLGARLPAPVPQLCCEIGEDFRCHRQRGVTQPVVEVRQPREQSVDHLFGPQGRSSKAARSCRLLVISLTSTRYSPEPVRSCRFARPNALLAHQGSDGECGPRKTSATNARRSVNALSDLAHKQLRPGVRGAWRGRKTLAPGPVHLGGRKVGALAPRSRRAAPACPAERQVASRAGGASAGRRGSARISKITGVR